MWQGKNAWMLIKTDIPLSKIKIIFDVSFYLTFVNIQNSLFYNSKQHFKFIKSSNFCFSNYYVCEHSSRRSVKWRKAFHEMGGNIPGGNFSGGTFLELIWVNQIVKVTLQLPIFAILQQTLYVVFCTFK